MRFSSLVLAALSLTAILSTAPARAEVFVWQDEHSKVSWTFPDRWAVVNDQKPDDVITIMAPGDDEAACRLRTREDRRFVIYPRRLDDRVQRTNFTRDFWTAYAGQFENANIDAFRDDAGLGLAFASMAEMSFVPDVGPKVSKRGLMLAGVYNDTAYIFECSASADSYKKWRAPFMGVLHSVDMRLIRPSHPAGFYRNFLADPDTTIHGARPEDNYNF